MIVRIIILEKSLYPFNCIARLSKGASLQVIHSAKTCYAIQGQMRQRLLSLLREIKLTPIVLHVV